MEIDKISWSCFDDKKFVLNDGIYTLAYFHKDSVTSCEKFKKDCDKREEIEKDCDKKDYDKKDCEEFEKDCDKKKIKKNFDGKDCKKTSC